LAAYLTAALTLTRLSLTKGHAISAHDTDHGGMSLSGNYPLCVFFLLLAYIVASITIPIGQRNENKKNVSD
jgi:hypothetical protein